MRLYKASWRPIARIDQGPRPQTDFIVVHTMQSESLAGTEHWFKTSSPDEAGAHVGIGKHGATWQWVDLNHKCYHAKTAGNARGIGIELAGYAEYGSARWLVRVLQRRALAAALARICHAYDLGAPHYSSGRGNVIGHCDVPGNDHTDPGSGFPWERVIRLARRKYRAWYG